MKFLIITGMSGAGRSTILHHLEDCGYQCMDNLPPVILSQVFSLCDHIEVGAPLALGVDTRSGNLFDADAVTRAIDDARPGNDISVLFLDSDDETLIDRYKETRRDHPLMKGGMTLEAAICRERELLQPIREKSDFVISTNTLHTRELCQEVDRLLLSDNVSLKLRTEIMSFGFKRGIPRESDLVFDVRFLPNPFYIREIRSYTGLDAPIRDFVLGKAETQKFLHHLYAMVDDLLPLYAKEGKRRLMIAIGCTGGAHRSVAISEALYQHLLSNNHRVSVTHRDISLEQASWPFRQERGDSPVSS